MPARAWLWLLAALIEVCTPTALRNRLAGLRFDAAHLPERFATFVLIALGEALVGAGATESRAALSRPALVALVLAFTLACGLWWTYFHFGASALEHALRRATVQAGLVRAVFTNGHLVLVLGLVLIAAGSSEAAERPTATLHGAHAYFLGVGTALYLFTFCYTRVRMFGGVGVARLVGGVLALAVAAVSPRLPQLAVLGALVLLLIALNVFEGWMVASGRPMAVIRVGRGAIPAE
jgi:low temperature requirement protein LtrA